MSEVKIAKYRKDGNTEEWWLTNFTMEQVEGRLRFLEQALAAKDAEIAELRAERDAAHAELVHLKVGERELLEDAYNAGFSASCKESGDYDVGEDNFDGWYASHQKERK